jgi:hypothetical protein
MVGRVKPSAPIAVLFFLSAAMAPHLLAQKTPTFDVTGPTIIAFFPPVTDAELRKDPDTNEALSDFQYYAGQVRDPLKKKGIVFHEVYAHQVTIRMGKSVTTFKPGEIQVGYYFVAPGKKPVIKYGVETDAGLYQLADEYFGSIPK